MTQPSININNSKKDITYMLVKIKKKEKIYGFVSCGDTDTIYNFTFHILGVDPMKDVRFCPDNINKDSVIYVYSLKSKKGISFKIKY